jgi:hypothetical protein
MLVCSAPYAQAQVLFPERIDMGNVVVGLVYPQTMTLINTSNETIYPKDILCNGYGYVNFETILPDSVKAGDTVQFALIIRPTMMAPIEEKCGILRDYTKPGKNWSVGYSVYGNINAESQFSVSDQLLEFGDVEVGDTASALFAIVNSGNGAGTVRLRQFTSTEYSVSINSDTMLVNGADTLLVTVLFHPTQEQQVLDTLLFEMSDNRWSPRTVVVNGTGIPSKPGVAPSFTSVTFPSAPINSSTSTEIELSVRSGSATVTEIFAINGEVFSVQLPPALTSLPIVVQPDSPFTFAIVAEPAMTGMWLDTIIVRTEEFDDLRIPVEANAVISHVDEYAASCLPHPNPSHGAVTWCTDAYSAWIVADVRGQTIARVTADEEGRCNISGLDSGTYVLRSQRESVSYLLIVLE